MIAKYNIKGMTCGACVARVKKALEQIEAVDHAEIQLAIPQAQLQLKNPVTIEKLQKTIGKYQIQAVDFAESEIANIPDFPEKSWQTYQPLLLIVAFITAVSLLVQYPFGQFSGMLWMRHFMAGFFLVFSFFKLLNIRGFAESYQMYDVIATRWKSWGYVYPFIELSLGILYLINLAPFYLNIATLLILGISTIGVIKSNLDKRKIKCACLGDVFNLPMSTVTIIEDVSMFVMAAVMLIYN